MPALHLQGVWHSREYPTAWNGNDVQVGTMGSARSDCRKTGGLPLRAGQQHLADPLLCQAWAAGMKGLRRMGTGLMTGA